MTTSFLVLIFKLYSLGRGGFFQFQAVQPGLRGQLDGFALEGCLFGAGEGIFCFHRGCGGSGDWVSAGLCLSSFFAGCLQFLRSSAQSSCLDVGWFRNEIAHREILSRSEPSGQGKPSCRGDGTARAGWRRCGDGSGKASQGKIGVDTDNDKYRDPSLRSG